MREGLRTCQRARKKRRQESGHRLQCPRKTVDRKRPRHFGRSFWPLPFPDQWGWGKQSQGINEYRTNPWRWHRPRRIVFRASRVAIPLHPGSQPYGNRIADANTRAAYFETGTRGYSQCIIDECLPPSYQDSRLLGRQVRSGEFH